MEASACGAGLLGSQTEAVTDVLRLEALQVECIVGVHPHERELPQPLVVDLEVAFSVQEAARRERLGLSMDYAEVESQVVFLLRNARFRLVESAAEAIARLLLVPPAPGERRASADRVRVVLRKPRALDGRAVPCITVDRRRDEVSFGREHKPFGRVDVVFETPTVGIYRLHVEAGCSIPLHIHRRMSEAEMLLTDGLVVNGQAWPRGTVFHWPLETPHAHDNPTRRVQSVLCIDSPPFEEDDEVPVDGTPAHGVCPEDPWGRPLVASL